MTTSFLGTELKFSAPVEDTIIFSSISMLGRETGTEPVAIIAFLNLKFF